MSVNFKIVKVLETGKIFLAKPYFLEASSKHTLFCEYKEDRIPKFKQWGLRNEYNTDLEIIGNYEADKISFSWRNGIKYIK